MTSGHGSTMLSDIVVPPLPADLGYKASFHVEGTSISESLADLHAPAWWSGVKVIASKTPDTIFNMQMIAGDHVLFEWTQRGDATWVPLPWPIPAAAGKDMDLRLVASASEPLIFAMKTCFHELPGMQMRDRYLFVTKEGRPVLFWDGVKHTWNVPERDGDPPTWRTLHWLVRPTGQGGASETGCFHAWDEIFAPPPPEESVT